MLDTYQQQLSKTYKTYPKFSETDLRLLDWGLGLGGESGEVLDILKHHVLHQEPLDKMELAKELGDVMWYLTAIAQTVDIKMIDVLRLNMAKLAHRHGGQYDASGSVNRHAKEVAFKETELYKELEDRIVCGIYTTEPAESTEPVELVEPHWVQELEEDFKVVVAYWKEQEKINNPEAKEAIACSRAERLKTMTTNFARGCSDAGHR